MPEAALLALLEAHDLGPVMVVDRTRNARTGHPASIALTLVAGPTSASHDV